MTGRPRCAACGSLNVEVLDAGVIERGPDGRREVLERITTCAPPPSGCGTTRVQRETRELADLGTTTKRYVRGWNRAEERATRPPPLATARCRRSAAA